MLVLGTENKNRRPKEEIEMAGIDIHDPKNWSFETRQLHIGPDLRDHILCVP